MSRAVQAMFSLLLMATYVATVLARVPQPQQNFPTIPGFPGLLPPGVPSLLPPGLLPPPVNPVDIEKCWSSLQNIPGCAFEITNSILTGRFGLGPACCKAFTAIDQNCWGKMFPMFPAFPPLIKSNCDKVNAAPPKAV